MLHVAKLLTLSIFGQKMGNVSDCDLLWKEEMSFINCFPSFQISPHAPSNLINTEVNVPCKRKLWSFLVYVLFIFIHGHSKYWYMTENWLNTEKQRPRIKWALYKIINQKLYLIVTVVQFNMFFWNVLDKNLQVSNLLMVAVTASGNYL